MNSLDKDLKTMQLELGDSYNLSLISLLKIDSCRDIAIYFFNKLKEQGKNSSLLVLGEKFRSFEENNFDPSFRISFNDRTSLPGSISYYGHLYPIPFQKLPSGSWGSHIVCISNGIVYDPSIGKKTNLANYMMEMFGKEVNHEVYEFNF